MNILDAEMLRVSAAGHSLAADLDSIKVWHGAVFDGRYLIATEAKFSALTLIDLGNGGFSIQGPGLDLTLNYKYMDGSEPFFQGELKITSGDKVVTDQVYSTDFRGPTCASAGK